MACILHPKICATDTVKDSFEPYLETITVTTKQHQPTNQKTYHTQSAGSVSLKQPELMCFAQVDSGEEKHHKSSYNEALLLGFEPATFKLSNN